MICPGCGRDLTKVMEKVGEVRFCPYCRTQLVEDKRVVAIRVVVNDKSFDFQLEDGESFVIGRKDLTTAVTPDKLQYVSRKHVRIFNDGGEVFVEDLNSTNGTKLNGVEIKGGRPRRLRSGDEITLGGFVRMMIEFSTK